MLLILINKKGRYAPPFLLKNFVDLKRINCLFNRYRFCQIAWLIYVTTPHHGNMIR